MYKDLQKSLSEKEVTPELLDLLMMTYLQATHKLITAQDPEISEEEAIDIARMNALKVFDQAIANQRLENVEMHNYLSERFHFKVK